MERQALNINQLKSSVRNIMDDISTKLLGNIRAVGLREKLERRQDTLAKVLDVLVNHSDLPNIISESEANGVCPDCGNLGWKQDNKQGALVNCPCYY